MSTHSLHGIPLLATLDRVALSNAMLTAALVVAGAVLTGGGSLLLADWVSARSTEPVTPTDIAFSVFNGALAGLCLGLARTASRHLESSVRRALAHDPGVAARLDGPALHMRRRWIALLVVMLFVFQAWFRLFREARAAAGDAVDLVHGVYLLAPLLLNFMAGGLLIVAFGTAVVLLRRLAVGVDLDLRRLERYSCFALPALYLMAALSIALGAGAATIVLFDGAEDVVPDYLGRTSTMFLLALPFALWPMSEIHRRIVIVRDEERERVLRALDGETPGLVDSVVDRRHRRDAPAPGGDSGAATGAATGEWMSHLLWLDSLPTWPLGGYLQRFVLFGLLPPITWVLAAVVENLLF